MSRIKTDLYNKNIDAKIAEGNAIAPKMQADTNAQVVTAGKALATETTNLGAKETVQIQKKKDATAATVALHTEEITWNGILDAAAKKVMEIYPNNPEKWKGFGFEIADSTTPSTGVPDKTANLSVTTGDTSGHVDLHWDKTPYAKSYKIRMTEGDPAVEANWKPANPDVSTKSSITEINLNAGKLTYFQVAAFNANGVGAWSDAVGKIVS